MYVQERNEATLWLFAGTLYHHIKKYAKRFKDTKGINRSCKLDKDRKERKRTKGQTMIYRTLHRKIKIEQQESN